MTSSGRCSGRRALVRAAALAGAVAALGCGHGGPRPGVAVVRPRVVLLPVENLAARSVPVKEVQTAVEVALRRGFDVVGGDILEEFLVRHRLRFSGGVDRETALAARDELGADAILVTSLTAYRSSSPPAAGIAMRLVSATEQPIILWMDQASFTGDEAPGLLGLGVVESIRVAQDRVVKRLVRSLEATLEGNPLDAGCDTDPRYEPAVRFRARVPDAEAHTIAVVPFLNRTSRRGAGDAVALEFVRQLVDSGRFRVLEPGVIREYLLRARVIMPGGVSLETTRLLLGAMEVDLVVSGVVLDYGESGGKEGPTIRFSATMLEGHGGSVVWQSSSFNRGDDGVYLWDIGRVLTAGKLACRMVEPVVSRMLENVAKSTARSAGKPAATPDGSPSPERHLHRADAAPRH
jgi:hypothetical protein